MSAIWALLHLDGAPVDPAHLEHMSAALMPLGPESSAIWREGHAGLGHRLMAFTPEDQYEQQPLLSADGRLALVYDGRLDNRPELVETLKLNPADARLWPDSVFVLRALQTWSEDCPTRLIGSFAFIAWDRQRRRLFAAASPSNSAALFYHHTPRALALAGLPQGLLALPWVPRRLDQIKLAEFLVHAAGADRSATLFEGLHRLLGGHTLAAEAGRVDIRPYWTPDPRRELRLPGDDDYVEAFNVLFKRVVNDHLRSATPAAIMLSGGLDSTSVAAVAAPLLMARGQDLLSFTSIPDARAVETGVPAGRFADETACVRAVASLYSNLTPEFIATDGLCFLDGLEAHFEHNLAPPRTLTNRLWLDAILRAAAARGRRVILTGEAGNRTISWAGHWVISYYLRRGHLGAAWREARALSQRLPRYPLWRALMVHGLAPLLPNAIGNRLERHAGAEASLSPLRPGYAAAHGLKLRQTGAAGYSRQPGGQRLRQTGGDYHGAAWRAQFGMDARDPTRDQRIIEFCLSVPHDQFQRLGRPRWLVRRAMAGRLPPEVIDNPLRGLQSADWLYRLRQRREDVVSTLALLRADGLARDLLDLERAGRVIETWPDPAGNPSLTDEYFVAQNVLAAGRFIVWAQTGA